MAQYEYCIPGKHICKAGIPCIDVPKLPNMAEIFKTCPLPYAQDPNLLMLLLLLIFIVAAVMFGIRRVRTQPNLGNDSQLSASSVAGLQDNVVPHSSTGHELQTRGVTPKPIAV